VTGSELFAPRALWSIACPWFWPAWVLTAMLFCAAVASRFLRCRQDNCWHCRVACLASLLRTWPVYAWSLLASIGTILTFETLTVHGLPMQVFWAPALAQVFGLAPILLLVAIGVPLVPSDPPRLRIASIGPVCAVGAVAADWIFFLTVITPFR